MTIAVAPQRPTPGAPRDYRFPAFERLTLDNGLSIVIAPVPKLPVVTVLALVDAGASADPSGNEGVALLTAHSLAEGTERRDGIALADQFERLGTALDTSADWDSAVVRVTVTSSRLSEAIELVAEVLRTKFASEITSPNTTTSTAMVVNNSINVKPRRRLMGE